MGQLSNCLEQLFEFLTNRQLFPPSRDVRIVEVGRATEVDRRGRLQLSAAALKEPAAYEARFDEIVKSGLPWINISCYGVHKGLLIVAVEIPGSGAGIRSSKPLSVNYSGPTDSVIKHGWDVSSIATIE
jgi:hypothetical protein